MKHHILGLAAVVLGSGSVGHASPVASPGALRRAAGKARTSIPFNALASLRECLITSGPFKGAYVTAQLGYLNWYFDNLGLAGFVRTQPKLVRPYLDLYVRHLNADASINDVDFSYKDVSQDTAYRRPSIHIPRPDNGHNSDSNDSYAATFLSLVRLYVHYSGDRAWVTANMGTLKRIGRRNLLDQQKPSGLIKNFQNGDFGFLQDNAECYRGLQDFAFVLSNFGQPAESKLYVTAAQGVSRGIRSLYDARALAYHHVDDNSSIGRTFYPDAVTQVFPQIFDVPQGNASETQKIYDVAYNALNSRAPEWPSAPRKYDFFVWMPLGYAAAKRGDTRRANAHLQAVRALLTTNDATSEPRSRVTINELGWYQRTADWLAGYRY